MDEKRVFQTLSSRKNTYKNLKFQETKHFIKFQAVKFLLIVGLKLQNQ